MSVDTVLQSATDWLHPTHLSYVRMHTGLIDCVVPTHTQTVQKHTHSLDIIMLCTVSVLINHQQCPALAVSVLNGPSPGDTTSTPVSSRLRLSPSLSSQQGCAISLWGGISRARAGDMRTSACTFAHVVSEALALPTASSNR